MLMLFETALLIANLFALCLSAIILIETIASLFSETQKGIDVEPGSVAVIVPAHNEALLIGDTIRNISSQLRAQDRIVVIADNCADETARRASAAGADVIERNDPAHIGKGYALQYGVDHLRAAPPDIVAFVDADCRLNDGALQKIAARAAALQRPVQAIYDMTPPPDATGKLRLAAFAWRFMNRVRMAGLQTIADVTRLTGAGMAFPWRIIEAAKLASGEIVEDLALSLEMASSEAPAALCLSAGLTSEFPQEEAAQFRQAARWSNGSLAFATMKAPGFVVRGLKDGNIRLVALAFDALVPPLTIFATLLVGLWFASAATMLAGGGVAFFIASAAAAVLGAALVIAWFKVGRDLLTLAQAPELLRFFVGRLAVFGGAGRRSAARWTPTRADDE